MARVIRNHLKRNPRAISIHFVHVRSHFYSKFSEMTNAFRKPTKFVINDCNEWNLTYTRAHVCNQQILRNEWNTKVDCFIAICLIKKPDLPDVRSYLYFSSSTFLSKFSVITPCSV